MATQLKSDFQPTFRPAPRPTLRVVFDTASATNAVIAAVDKMPLAVREATLEEIAIGSAAEALIASARQVLSPAPFRAFLRWGVAAARFVQEGGGDDTNGDLCQRTNDAIGDLSATIAITVEDRNLKIWIAALEAADCDCSFGPLEITASTPVLVDVTIAGVAADLTASSPLCRALDELGHMVRAASPSRGEWGHSVAQVVIDAFSAALDMDVDLPSSAMFQHGEVAHVIDPSGRDLLVSWGQAQEAYRAAQAASSEVEGDSDPDDLCGAAEYDALRRLLLTPAPNAAALAIKARLYEETEAWELTAAADIARAFASDTRRLARIGTGASDDATLLEAQATCVQARHALGALPIDHIPSDEDAIWAWEDVATMTLINTTATTAAGVIAKLRRGFLGVNHDDWAEDALLDPSSSRFQDGLRKADIYERMIWSAISDLAQIAGIDLVTSPNTSAPRDLHRSWFEARNTLIKRLDQPTPGVRSSADSEDQMSSGCELLNQFDNTILGTRPTTPDGLMTQLVLATQLIAEGHEIGPEVAIDLVASAERLVGMGTVSSACPIEVQA